MWSSLGEATEQEPSTMQISTIGLDLAKRVFQIDGADAAGQVRTAKASVCRGGAC
jgi:hypothetical protein